MGTTELQAEQVIVGGVVLAAVLLPWAPEIVAALNANTGVSQLVAGAGAILVAYVLGVVFDRLADTLTEWLERCQRLLFIERALKEGKVESPNDGRCPERTQWRRSGGNSSTATTAPMACPLLPSSGCTRQSGAARRWCWQPSRWRHSSS
jgi:hypothetical protein